MLNIFRSNLATAANDTLDEGKKFSQTALLNQAVGSKAIKNDSSLTVYALYSYEII